MKIMKALTLLIILSFIQTYLFSQNEIIDISQPNNNLVSDTTIFGFTEILPEFTSFEGKDTRERLDNFINDNLRWPNQLDYEGRVYIQVVIEKDGQLSNFKILRGLDSCAGFNEEALRVLKLLPRWKPGKMKGKEVRVSFIIPVKFMLSTK
jgi:TonB family protein